MTARPWTTHELSVLHHFAGTSRHWRAECAAVLGRTVSEVKGAIERQRAKRMSAERNYKKWDPIDDDLAVLYRGMGYPASYIAFTLGRTTAAVNRRLHKLRKPK